jgi:transcriptional regulator with XRE-family HTH domain
VIERTELAGFLRARREQLQPADVGLRDSGRRRTPGLRREEVATLAGMSIDYLVRLEQGRDVNPSASVITALAGALRLSEDDRLHLARLARCSGSESELCPTKTALVDVVAPTVKLLLDRLDPTPTFVVGPANDVLAWNRSWQKLVEPIGLLDGTPPNLARFVFADPRAHDAYPDWSRAADEQVSRLRAASLRWNEDVRFMALVAELSDLPEFASRWSAHVVSEKHRGTKRLDHPLVGELRVAYEVLLLPDDGEQRLISWFPADDASAVALRTAIDELLPVSPAHLRVVRGA